MHLSRDDFLKAEDLVTEEVDLSDLPGYNGSVLVRGMTGRERDEFEVSTVDRRNGERNLVNARARVVIRCVVDDDGKRLFDDADIDVLGGKSAAALDRLYEVAAKLSGMRDEDEKEMAGDFGGEGGSSSSTASPPGSAKPSKNSSAR
jgi:hypothetical protein